LKKRITQLAKIKEMADDVETTSDLETFNIHKIKNAVSAKCSTTNCEIDKNALSSELNSLHAILQFLLKSMILVVKQY